jgi:hypothetical protein
MNVANPPVLRTAFRVLTFLATADEIRAMGSRHLAFGLIATWIVGIGRYWDSPDAVFLQRLGMGSIIYVFVLSFLLYLVLKPLRLEFLKYENVLTYVTLTAPPAILYAIPVERFMGMDAAMVTNMWFLGVVATWRVLLYVVYVARVAKIGFFGSVVVTLLPVTFIITGLTILNLNRAVFDIMRGLHGAQTAHDQAYAIMVGLSLMSVLAFIPLVILYGALIYDRTRKGLDPDSWERRHLG